MRIAYLILAHQQPRHLARLLRALDCEWADYYLHVDRKSAIRDFRSIVPETPRVKFIDNRVNVRWGGYSQVAATLRLILAALGTKRGYTHYILLSGADYPIKSNNHIRSCIGAGNRQFINIERALTGEAKCPEYAFRVERHFINDWLSPLSKNLLVAKTRGVIYRLLPARTPDFPLYYGSQWWCLTHECIDHIIRFVERNPKFSRYCRAVFIPDEMFFQSIVMNSPYRAEIDGIADTAPAALGTPGTHFLQRDVGGATTTLDDADFAACEQSPCLFARKFREGRSDALLGKIDRLLLRYP